MEERLQKVLAAAGVASRREAEKVITAGRVRVNGKLVTGVNYAAGEMGHTVLVYNGLQCNCGRKGCWEQYASATALISQTKEAMLENKESKMWQLCNGNIDNASGRTAFSAMYEGDEAAKQVVDQYIKYVAIGVTNIVNIFQPDVICIGGGISKEGDNLLNPVKAQIADRCYGNLKTAEIVMAQLGNDAGILGAALL